MYILDITPFPTPRPRLSKFGAYYPADYTKKKAALIQLVKALKIPEDEHYAIVAAFYLPYPKSTAKKNLIEGARHTKKPDSDNLFKGLSDALEQAGIFKNDSSISDVTIFKRYTTNTTGRIEFKLY